MILRAAIVAGAVGALLASSAAAAPGAPSGLEFVALAAMASALVSTVLPDHHVGLVTSMLIGVHWWLGVDDVATPWSMAAGAGLIAHHTALAAASLSPLGSTWSAPMRTRWLRRLLLVTAVAPPIWVGVWLLERTQVPASSPLVGAALLVLAVAVWWVRRRDAGEQPASGPNRRLAGPAS